MPFFAQGESDIFFLAVICMPVTLLWKISVIIWLTADWIDGFFNISCDNICNNMLTTKLGWSEDVKILEKA